MLNVGFISQDWSKVQDVLYPNGCTWYRCQLPAIALTRHGHTAHVGTLSFGSRDNIGVLLQPPLYPTSQIAAGHNIVVFKLPMHKTNVEAAERAHKSGAKVVVDIDDWFDNLPDSNKARDTTDPDKNPENNRNFYFQVIDIADALICSTPFLFDFYTKKYPSKLVLMVRNSIDLSRWPKRIPKNRRPVIGWVGATPWRANDLEQLSGFIGKYIKENNLKFHHSGHIENAPMAHELLGIERKYCTGQIMTPIINLPILFKEIDIGIVPLNNIPFNYAKSYLKGLEYAAAGVPFIASPTPEYEYLEAAGVGRIAHNQTEWTRHFDELLDGEMRSDEAAFNMDIISSQFTIESMAGQWVSAFSQIMDL